MKKKKAMRRRQRRYLRAGVLTLLCLLGVGLLAGMAMFNRNVKPDRDMQWYVRDGALEVAAPAQGEGFAAAGQRDSEFVAPGERMRTARAVPEAAAQPSEAPQAPSEDAAPVTAEVYAQSPDSGLMTAEGSGSADDFAPQLGFEADAEDAPGEAPGAEDDAEAGPEDALTPEGDAEAAEALPEDDAEAPEEEEETPVGPVTITITAAGDCTFCGEVGSKSYLRFADYVQKYGYDYFFSGVRSIFEADDLTIVNLEGPLTTSDKPHAHGFVFKADPQCAQILTGSSVELCNVANNHSQDYGKAGLKQTAEVLEQNGVGYCGYTAVYQKKIKGVRVCALGFDKWQNRPEKIVEAVAEARQNCDLLIVNMHWGWENKYQQDSVQTALGHAIIDAGADLVIGTHPHVVQGIEKYKDKYIVYSLGNFCFAGNANPPDKTCLIFQQSFGFLPGMGLVQAGISDEGINIIPATISSTNLKNDFQPTVMPADAGAALLQSVASHSRNFDVKNTLWMKDNYLLANGLIKSKKNRNQQGETQTADGEAADENSEAGDAEAASGDADGAADTGEMEALYDLEEPEPFFSLAGEDSDAI